VLWQFKVSILIAGRGNITNFGDIVGCQTWKKYYLLGEWTTGMLLKILQCPGHLLSTKNFPIHIISVEIEKSCI
jgi:hypothetical protein